MLFPIFFSDGLNGASHFVHMYNNHLVFTFLMHLLKIPWEQNQYHIRQLSNCHFITSNDGHHMSLKYHMSSKYKSVGLFPYCYGLIWQFFLFPFPVSAVRTFNFIWIWLFIAFGWGTCDESLRESAGEARLFNSWNPYHFSSANACYFVICFSLISTRSSTSGKFLVISSRLETQNNSFSRLAAKLWKKIPCYI